MAITGTVAGGREASISLTLLGPDGRRAEIVAIGMSLLRGSEVRVQVIEDGAVVIRSIS